MPKPSKRPKCKFPYVSHLDLKSPRKPAWMKMPHGPARRLAARAADAKRRAKTAEWKQGKYEGRDSNAHRVIDDIMISNMERAEAHALWQVARVRAEDMIDKMIDDGMLPDLEGVLVPETDEAIAKEALIQTAKVAFGPVDKKTKLEALKTVLTYTKQKPASKVEAKVQSVEDWLATLEDGE